MITVAAAETEANAHTLVHEYGHHVDATRGVAGAREPNGSSTWWRARGMARLVELRSAYHGYVRGWDRNIAEIFAEDYARLARPGSRHRIPWLEEPNEPVLAAILHDLGLGPEPTITTPPQLKPLSCAFAAAGSRRAARWRSRSACSAPAGACGRRSRSPAPPPQESARASSSAATAR